MFSLSQPWDCLKTEAPWIRRKGKQIEGMNIQESLLHLILNFKAETIRMINQHSLYLYVTFSSSLRITTTFMWLFYFPFVIISLAVWYLHYDIHVSNRYLEFNMSNTELL